MKLFANVFLGGYNKFILSNGSTKITIITYFLLFLSVIPIYASQRNTGAEVYLIVANQQIENNDDLNRFIRWKTEKGFDVNTHFIEADTPVEDIDAWVEEQYAIQYPYVKYLLIIGDCDGAFAVKTQEEGFASGVTDVVSDLIYGVYGEVSIDNYLPVIQVGRFSIRSLENLTAQINKTIWYEKDQFTSNADLSYLNNILGEVNNNDNIGVYSNPPLHDGWDNYFNNYTQNPFTGSNNDFNGIDYYYPHDEDVDMIQTIQNDITNGVGYFCYIGNADANQLKNPFFTISDVELINNADKYPFITFNC